MALSPYTKPTTPHDPNGIAHYVPDVDQDTVKGLWSTWVDSWKAGYDNPPAIVVTDCETAWSTAVISSNTDGDKTIGQYTFISLGSTFITDSVVAGDTLEITSGTEQGTYVIASVDLETQLTIILDSGWVSTENTLTFIIHNSTTVETALRTRSPFVDLFSVAISIENAFTTGPVAYITIPTVDLSTRQRLYFAIKQTTGSAIAADDWSIRLCSDSFGNTPIDTINIPDVPQSNDWSRFIVDKGSVFGATINSVALYVNVNTNGKKTIMLDNIIALEPLPTAFDYPGLYTNGAP